MPAELSAGKLHSRLPRWMGFSIGVRPLVIKQEITNNAVAASKLSNPLCLIIDAVCIQSRKKGFAIDYPFDSAQDKFSIDY